MVHTRRDTKNVCWFLAFFSVVASNQISPHFDDAKVRHFIKTPSN